MKKPSSDKKFIVVNDFKVLRVKAFDNGDIVFDLEINSIRIYGCRVVEGKNGDFISWPQRKGSDNKYYAIASAYISNDDQGKILAEVEKQL